MIPKPTLNPGEPFPINSGAAIQKGKGKILQMIEEQDRRDKLKAKLVRRKRK